MNSLQILQALPDLLPEQDDVPTGPRGWGGGDHLPGVHRYMQCHVSHSTAGQPDILPSPGQSSRAITNIALELNTSFYSLFLLLKPSVGTN